MSHLLTRHKMKTHNNTLANLCRGVVERVLYTNARLDRPIKPDPGYFELKLASYRDRLARLVGGQSPVTREEFVDFYKGPRRTVYKNAVDGLAAMPFRSRDAILKTFVKAEKVNLSLKPDPVPRVIQPRGPRFNVELGRYLRPVEKVIYQKINEMFEGPTIMSEFNAYRQAEIIVEKWEQFRQPVCLGLDASRFDQHVSTDALKFEHKLYDMIFHSAELRKILSKQLVNHGIASASDGQFRYRVQGGRMSGDMNTSLGNKIIMCLMAKSYIDDLGIPIQFVNNGDDCLMITERKHLPRFRGLVEYFKRFGFNIVTETPVYEVEQIEFCQSKPVCVNNVWRMVRNVKTCLSKDVTCVSLGHDIKQYRAWLYDVGNCGLSYAADVPVLGRFYQALVRMGEEGTYHTSGNKEFTWYIQASRNTTCKHDSPDANGRYSFWLSTGISPEQQIIMEKQFDSMLWGANVRQHIDLSVLLSNG